MQLLWSSQISAVAWRVRYLSSTRKGAESHTIMVQDIPGTLSGTFVGRVYEVRTPSVLSLSNTREPFHCCAANAVMQVGGPELSAGAMMHM